MRTRFGGVAAVALILYIQECSSYLPSLRKPPSPASAEDLDRDPKKQMWNGVVKISPNGKREFMKVALRESISGKMCKFPAVFREYIAWDCIKNSCPVDLKPGEKPTKPSFKIESQTWEKCSSNYQSENFWLAHQDEYLDWAEQKQFYNVNKIYSNGSWIYLPIAQRHSKNSTQQCVLPGVGYDSKSNDVLTDCQRFAGAYECQVVVVEDVVKPWRKRRSGENFEKLVWKECDMGFQTSQIILDQKQQISKINNSNNNKIILDSKQQISNINSAYNNNSSSSQQQGFSLWWIVLIVAVCAILLVSFVWWQDKRSKKRDIFENLDDQNDQANLDQILENSLEGENRFEQNQSNQQNQDEEQVEQQVQDQQEELRSFVKEQELVKISQ